MSPPARTVMLWVEVFLVLNLLGAASAYIRNNPSTVPFVSMRKPVFDSKIAGENDPAAEGFSKPRVNVKRALLQGAAGLIGGTLISMSGFPGILTASSNSNAQYPIMGSSDLMTTKSHGTSDNPVQSKLRWNVDVKLADRISNYNRNWAEFAGYWTRDSSFLSEVDSSPGAVTTFYDSVTGVPLFKAPVGRSFQEWKDESMYHGWPSFRDSEVIWDNVRSLRDGEMVSLTGTHLGHNLPDGKGNRYCINLVSIAGNPSSADPVVEVAAAGAADNSQK